MHNVALRCVHINHVQWEGENSLCVYRWAARRCQLYKGTEWNTTTLLWQICVAGNNANYTYLFLDAFAKLSKSDY